MFNKYLVTVVILVVAIVIRWVINMKEFMSLPANYKTNDKSCELVGEGVGMIGSEDVVLGKHGVIFISSGDLHSVFKNGAHTANPGGIWVLNMETDGNHGLAKVDIVDFPTDKLFQPHGIDVSNVTDRVLAVSHNGDHSSVDIFQIVYNIECLEEVPWSCSSPVTLYFLKSITSDLFPNTGINDVVESGSDQFYVTQWQPFAFPTMGQNNPEGVLGYLKKILPVPILLLNIKLTTVFHCVWSEVESNCTPATQERFIGANGITISKDRKTVFVNDPIRKEVTVMMRCEKSGVLTKMETIPLPVAVDNIEYDDETNEILMGTIPDIGLALEKDNNYGGITIVPGGLALLSKKREEWTFKTILEHDGSKLSQISAGTRLGNKVVLGSPLSEGVLVCVS